MILSIRQVTVMPGKVGAARAFAAEVTEYVKGAHKLDFEIVRPVGGSPQRVAWVGRYKDLAAYEDAMNKLAGDRRFAELSTKTADLWVPGTMQDEIWQSN
jgi:hypothetical protein